MMERAAAVSQEVEHGTLPFDQRVCYADKLLIALALPARKAQWRR